MKPDRTLEISLLILRISVGVLFVVWAIGKLVSPALTQDVAQTYYSSSLQIGSALSILMGVAQLIVIFLFLTGLLKTWSYGALLGMHVVSVLVAYEPLLKPYTPPNILFWAGIPTLGALVALFLLRDRDQLLTLSRRSSFREVDSLN